MNLELGNYNSTGWLKKKIPILLINQFKILDSSCLDKPTYSLFIFETNVNRNPFSRSMYSYQGVLNRRLRIPDRPQLCEYEVPTSYAHSIYKTNLQVKSETEGTLEKTRVHLGSSIDNLTPSNSYLYAPAFSRDIYHL